MSFSKEEFIEISRNFNYKDEDGTIKKPICVPITNIDMNTLNADDGSVLCPDENVLLIRVDVDRASELPVDYNNLYNNFGEYTQVYDLNLTKENLKSGILDIDLFKDKLEFYGLYTEKMKEFLDLYLKLYNKE